MKLTYTIQPNDNFFNVKELLKLKFQISDRLLVKLKKNKKIWLNSTPTFVDSRLKPFDIVEILIDFEEKSENIIPTQMDLNIIYEDEYYIADLLGMKVLLEDGSEFGTLKNVMETGANDVYIVDSVEHGEVLLPAIKECILDVDIETNTMTVHLMKGLL